MFIYYLRMNKNQSQNFIEVILNYDALA